MGDLNRGETFANGEQVTAARLNKMQDDATLQDGAVTTAKIADGAVTPAKLSGSFAFSAGQIQIASGSLIGGNGSNVGVAIAPDGATVEINGTTLRVKDAGIVEAKLANLAVATGKLAARAVTAAKFAAVGTARLLGRFSAGAGDFEEISIGTGLTLSGSGVLSSNAGTRNTFIGAAKALPAGAGIVQWISTDGWPFSAVPEYAEARLVCTTLGDGFSVGTEIPISQLYSWLTGGFGGAMPLVTLAGVQLHFKAGDIYALNAAGSGVLLTRSRWNVKLYAEKW